MLYMAVNRIIILMNEFVSNEFIKTTGMIPQLPTLVPIDGGGCRDSLGFSFIFILKKQLMH